MIRATVSPRTPQSTKPFLVFSNVNSVVEFGFRQNGIRLVGFEFPEDRFGAAPDSLLEAVQSTTD